MSVTGSEALAQLLRQVMQQSLVQRRRPLNVELPGGQILGMTRADAGRLMVRTEGLSWALHLPSANGDQVLRGEEAYAIIARAIPLFIRSSSRAVVRKAFALLRSSPDEAAFVHSIASRIQRR